MSRSPVVADPRGPSLEAYFLGSVDYDACLALQLRLVYELSGRDDGQIAVLLCEHPWTLTMGRRGSLAHVRFETADLVSRGIELRWVGRGDGCLLHAPGQLAVYPIVPLRWHGLSVGDYLDRLQAAVQGTLSDVGITTTSRPAEHGLWGRTGQLVALGVAVRHWTTFHGASINVHPALEPFRHVDSDPTGGTRMSSLVVERHVPVRMASVRAAVVRRLASVFDCSRWHVHSGHPLLAEFQRATTAFSSRVG